MSKGTTQAVLQVVFQAVVIAEGGPDLQDRLGSFGIVPEHFRAFHAPIVIFLTSDRGSA